MLNSSCVGMEAVILVCMWVLFSLGCVFLIGGDLRSLFGISFRGAEVRWWSDMIGW